MKLNWKMLFSRIPLLATLIFRRFAETHPLVLMEGLNWAADDLKFIS
jgi:hypothetical protein